MVNEQPGKFAWAVPKELGIPADTLRVRLDFFHQSTVMTSFSDDKVITKQVDAMDVAHALARELTMGTGLLPDNTLWWINSRGGPIHAIYVPPKRWRLTLQDDIKKPLQRFDVPLPGFVFLCMSGRAPWVVAVKKRPTKETDLIYHAPLSNVFHNGRSCPGSNKYPTRIADIVPAFFTSFFSSTADLKNRSKKYPGNIIDLWRSLDKKNKFPMEDMIEFGTIGDLLKFGTGEKE